MHTIAAHRRSNMSCPTPHKKRLVLSVKVVTVCGCLSVPTELFRFENSPYPTKQDRLASQRTRKRGIGPSTRWMQYNLVKGDFTSAARRWPRRVGLINPCIVRANTVHTYRRRQLEYGLFNGRYALLSFSLLRLEIHGCRSVQCRPRIGNLELTAKFNRLITLNTYVRPSG